jgi:CdiI immunity protein
MTGKRAREIFREDVRARYPQLSPFLEGYLNEFWPELHGSPENAVNAAISEHSVLAWKQVRRELKALLSEIADDSQLRAILNDGIGVNVYFKGADEARSFAERVERTLLRSINDHFKVARIKG